MSTYLVAFTVSDFQKLSNQMIHVWARREALDQARYAMDLGPKFLNFYTQFFNVKFPLPKVDMIALPDFSSGAMENWGLITFRYKFSLLLSKIKNLTIKLMRVFNVTYHA